VPDPWSFLQTHTRARIAQGRTGNSLPTRALLDFQLDHACARDAVYSTLDMDTLLTDLRRLDTQPLLLHSRATNRQTYLQRPDWGRKLDEESARTLNNRPKDGLGSTLAIVLADGLSATAVNNHALPVLGQLIPELKKLNWSMAPVCVVQQGRVAIGDEIAHALHAEMVLVLIGERPGLSSPDSLGAYLTYTPRPGLTDDARNCVSNIRPGVDSSEGLSYTLAAQKLLYLLSEMKTRRLSGVGLKDEMPTRTLPHTSSPAVTAQIPEIPD